MSSTNLSLREAPKFYEMDGSLRAYSNRAIVLAVGAVLVAVISVTALLFVRLQPPTVIRVLPSGEATVVSPTGTVKGTVTPDALKAVVASEAPNDYEKEAFVRTFLDRYLNYDTHTLTQNWSAALNMMTANLRHTAILEFQKNDTVGKLQDEQARSEFKLSNVEPTADPLTYNAYGVRTVHRLDKKTEAVEQMVEAYRIRLVSSERSSKNPTGLMIGEYTSTQIHGETKAPQFGTGEGQ
jgi:type IV secretory pathway component VirB8